MTHRLLSLIALAGGTGLLAASAWAKLPPPSDDAKAKAAEAAAKTAHAGKVDNYKLCQSMDRVAAFYRADAKKAGKDVKAATGTPACADPGPYVSPADAAASGAAKTAAAAPAAPATKTAAAAPAAAQAAAPAKPAAKKP